jgi:hypothetical protein
MYGGSVISIYYWLANGYAVFPIYYTSSHWSLGILLGLRCHVIPVNLWGFHHIRRVRLNRRLGHVLHFTLRFYSHCNSIHPFIHPSIHPSIHPFISYCNLCITLHCIALERGAKRRRSPLEQKAEGICKTKGKTLSSEMPKIVVEQRRSPLEQEPKASVEPKTKSS